jgi:hypothetical protein
MLLTSTTLESTMSLDLSTQKPNVHFCLAARQTPILSWRQPVLRSVPRARMPDNPHAWRKNSLHAGRLRLRSCPSHSALRGPGLRRPGAGRPLAQANLVGLRWGARGILASGGGTHGPLWDGPHAILGLREMRSWGDPWALAQMTPYHPGREAGRSGPLPAPHRARSRGRLRLPGARADAGDGER